MGLQKSHFNFSPILQKAKALPTEDPFKGQGKAACLLQLLS